MKNKSIYFYTRSFNYLTTPKSYSDNYTSVDAVDYQNLFPSKKFKSKEFPLLHELDTTNHLRKYFDKFEGKPNVVILIIEGLNDDYIHDYKGVNLMPFLSEMKNNCLYWDHCFTLGERSFAVVPSLLGSLPYGKIGFTLLDKLPEHLSLTSLLKNAHYQTDFFYGQGAWFHNKNRFFKYNNIDLIVDNNNFSDKYEKIIVGDDNYFWGYNDKDLFNQSFEVIDTINNPRFDVYYTGSTHSPFVIADDDMYGEKLSKLSEKLQNESDIQFFNTYSTYFKSILFLDDALSDFFEKYSERPEFENTLFVITGDHPMSEIPIKNSMKRYHVPLMIYSPKLKENQVFSNTVSHLDFYETILPFLKDYGLNMPETSTAFGENLFKSNNNIAFMNENRDVFDFYCDNYYISDGVLYEVDKDFNITNIDNAEVLEMMKRNLAIVKNTSDYTSLTDHIVTDELYASSLDCDLLASVRRYDTIKIKGEYFTMIPKVDVSQYDTLYMNITFDYKTDGKDLLIVYTTSDSKDNKISYITGGIGTSGTTFMLHTMLPVKHIDGSIFYKSYIYNKECRDMKVSNVRCTLIGK